MKLSRTRSIFLSLAATTGLCTALLSCYNNKLEELNTPAQSCSSIPTTYSGFVRGVVQNSCLSCHGSTVAGSSGRGVILEGHSNLQTWANNGRLIYVLTTNGSLSMPQSGSKLDACTIARIQSWVNAGAPNN